MLSIAESTYQCQFTAPASKVVSCSIVPRSTVTDELENAIAPYDGLKTNMTVTVPFSIHWAYNVMSEACIANASPAANEVPLPSAAVFQPLKE